MALETLSSQLKQNFYGTTCLNMLAVIANITPERTAAASRVSPAAVKRFWQKQITAELPSLALGRHKYAQFPRKKKKKKVVSLAGYISPGTLAKLWAKLFSVNSISTSVR